MAHENDGHRARLRERMMKEGLSNFQDHEVLELLLFQYLPYKDTNKIAHNLLSKFGNATVKARRKRYLSANYPR